MKKEKSVRKAEFQAALFRQLKSLIVPFIILAIILIGVLFISFSQGEAEPEEVVRVNGYEGEETEITLENDKLLFSMNSLTTQFSVTMKETGETWTSNPEGAAEDSAALEIEKNKLQSTVLLTYSTQNGVDALLDNYEYSIAKGISMIVFFRIRPLILLMKRHPRYSWQDIIRPRRRKSWNAKSTIFSKKKSRQL